MNSKIVDILCNPSINSQLPKLVSNKKMGGIGIPKRIDSTNLDF
jgi:hypothetical protein